MIYFLVNGNSKIGSGHFRRCLNIAKELAGTHKTKFISWSIDLTLEKELQLESIPLINISINEVVQLWQRFESTKDTLIVDSDNPAVHDIGFQESIKSTGTKLMIITVNSSYYYTCDLLLNQSILALYQTYRTAEHTKRLFGPKYFIYNDVYRNKEIQSPKKFRGNILIAFGSADPKGYTLSLLRFFCTKDLYKYSIHVVLGGLNRDKQEIKKFAKVSRNIQIHENLADLTSVYECNELAICSPGMMFWEMALFGIKCMLIPSSIREIESALVLHKQDYAYLLGDYSSGFSFDSEQVLYSELCEGVSIAKNLGNLQKKINPEGIGDICKEILKVSQI